MDHDNTQGDLQIQAAFYARVACEHRDQDIAVARQLAARRERLEHDGLKIEAERRLVDDGVSEVTLLRAVWERLRAAAAAGLVDRLYVLSPDRLARTHAHLMLLAEEFSRAGLELAWVDWPPSRAGLASEEPAASGTRIDQATGAEGA